MVLSKSFIVVLLNALSVSVESFVINHPSASTLATVTSGYVPTPTYLFAEEENETEAATSEETVEPVEVAPAAGADTDILNSPAFLKRKLEVLKSDIAETEKETVEAQKSAEEGKAEWGPQLDALRLEYKNIQGRMSSQVKVRDVEATRAVVREMLEVLDNFDRAFGAVQAESDEEKAIEAEFKEGYQMVMDTFTKLGVEEVTTVGIEFDYEIHQAVMQMPSEDYEEGIVCSEFQKGFKIGDLLIRAAMVAVAA